MIGPEERARLQRYVVTGGGAAVIDLGAFALLTTTALPVLVAAAASFLVANVANFALSARYAFGHAPDPRRYPAFLFAAGLGFAVNVAVTAISALALPEIAAKLVGIGVAFAANFAMNSRFVFPMATSVADEGARRRLDVGTAHQALPDEEAPHP